MLFNFFKGFSMALADSVPGVSGSTIAFLLGFYDRFIEAIYSLMGWSSKNRKSGLMFLCKIGVGWICGMAMCALLLSSIFEVYIYQMSSAFLGLTLCAIPFVIYQERSVLKGKYYNLIFTLLGILVVGAVLYINPALGADGVNMTHPSMGFMAYVFTAGIIATSAMILPGISGSTMLLVFGLYVPIITSIKELMHLKLQYFPILVCFGVGIIVGIVCIIKGLSHCLKNKRSQVMYLIIGLMTGSILAIINGPATLAVARPSLSLDTFSWTGFFSGAAILVIFELISKKGELHE